MADARLMNTPATAPLKARRALLWAHLRWELGRFRIYLWLLLSPVLGVALLGMYASDYTRDVIATIGGLILVGGGALTMLTIGVAVGHAEINAGIEEFEWSLPPRPESRYWSKLTFTLGISLFWALLLLIDTAISELLAGGSSLAYVVVAFAPMAVVVVPLAAMANTQRSAVMAIGVVLAGVTWAYAALLVGGPLLLNSGWVSAVAGLSLLIGTPALVVIGGIEYGRREFIGPDSKYLGWVTRAVIAVITVVFVAAVYLGIRNAIELRTPDSASDEEARMFTR